MRLSGSTDRPLRVPMVGAAHGETLVTIGHVVRATETAIRLVDGFDPSTHTRTLSPSCRPRHWFDSSSKEDSAALDEATLTDMAARLPGAADPPRPAAA